MGAREPSAGLIGRIGFKSRCFYSILGYNLGLATKCNGRQIYRPFFLPFRITTASKKHGVGMSECSDAEWPGGAMALFFGATSAVCFKGGDFKGSWLRRISGRVSAE